MSSRFLSLLLGENVNSYDQQFDTSNQDATAQLYETMAPFSLGTNQTKANKNVLEKKFLQNGRECYALHLSQRVWGFMFLPH